MDSEDVIIDEILSVKSDDGGDDVRRVSSIIIDMLNIPSVPSSDKRIEISADDRKILDILMQKIDECDAALRKPSCTSEVYIKLGNILFDEGKYDSALKYYEKAILLNKKNALTWRCKAKAYHEMGRYMRAIICYDESIKAENNPEVWAEKAESLIELGRCIEALECCDRAIRANKNLLIAWYNKAIAYIELDMYYDAIRCLDMALKIMPTNESYKRMKELCAMFIQDVE